RDGPRYSRKSPKKLPVNRLKSAFQAQHDKVAVRQGLTGRRAKKAEIGDPRFPGRQIRAGNTQAEIPGAAVLGVISETVPGHVQAYLRHTGDVQIGQDLEVMGLDPCPRFHAK